MKKLCTLLVLLTMAVLSVTAKQVGVSTAQQAGQYFLSSRITDASSKRLASLTLAYTAESKAQGIQAAQSKAYFYVFNAQSGFVIVAGDDAVAPILGYSTEGSFDPNNIPESAAKWFEGYIQQIRHTMSRRTPATPSVQTQWQNLLAGKQGERIAGATAVEPLCKTKWNQAPFYNDLCPYDSTEKKRAVTGCVATAMAQVMKYWNHPAKGSGNYSYNHNKYGTLSANFGDVTYDWAGMPNEMKDTNIPLATLMSHCGISIDMNYGVNSSSTKTLEGVATALKKYFGYVDNVKVLYRKEGFTDSAWIATLKGELDNKRPIQYAGIGSGGGHSFVCDGYDDKGLFHINWGWGGSSDGYFSVDILDPSDLGTGGGTGGFNSNQMAIVNIQPTAPAPMAVMQLSAMVTVSAPTVDFGAPFTVSTNIKNIGTAPFSGDITAGVFDNTGKSVGFVQILPGMKLARGEGTENLVFSSDGMKVMLPGEYFVKVYYRQAGGEWKIVEDYNNFSNYAKIKVVLRNDLQLTSPMTASPATFIKGNAASVAMKIKNISPTEFSGGVGVGLFSLEGELVEIIEEKAGTIPAGSELSLTFASNAIEDVDAGTYYLACLYQPTGGELAMVGSTANPNPITVTVILPDLQADKFENNNTPEKANLLPVTFSGNVAIINTDGSNCNEGEDYDFYKVNLPAGGNYAFAARLHDAASSDNGITYSLDALFSYSIDNGNTWSDAYDDVMDAPVQIPGGTSVLFYVSPYFLGETGDYLLEIGVEIGSMGVNENDAFAAAINIYPNPAEGNVTIDVQNVPGRIWRTELVSLQGLVLAETNDVHNGMINLPLTGVAAGIYVVRLNTSNGIITKKIIVE